MSESLNVEKNKSLAEFTSWKVGGAAQYYVAPSTIDELKEALIYSSKENLPYTILGGGSNSLVSDKGVKGLLIHTHLLSSVEVIEDKEKLVLEALAGTQKSEVLKHFMKSRLAPAIFLAGLPGDMAGGVVMNAGIGQKQKPREFVEIVDSFEVLRVDEAGRLQTQIYESTEVDWSYRKTPGWQPGVISKVRVSWPNEPDPEVLKLVRDGNKRRKSTQPLHQPSCGSVFKNPEGDHSGRLIESLGLKGFSIGGAQVSEKHANFIVNLGSATAQDIHDVISHVQTEVRKKTGVHLHNEVVYLGDWDK